MTATILRYINITLAAVLLSCIAADAQKLDINDFHLDSHNEEIYNNAKTNIYSPHNVELGDSLFTVGTQNNDIGVMALGRVLTIFGNLGTGDIAAADSLAETTRTLLKDNDEYKNAYYYIYYIQFLTKGFINDVHAALNIARSITKEAQTDNNTYGLRISYGALAAAYTLRDNPRLALENFVMQLDLTRKYGTPTDQIPIIVNMANCYAAMGNEKEAANCFDEALSMVSKTETPTVQIELYKMMVCANSYTDQEYIDKYDSFEKQGIIRMFMPLKEQQCVRAIYWATKRHKQLAIATADSIPDNGTRLTTLEEIYKKLGDYANAYKCKVDAYQIHDSLQAIIQLDDFSAMAAENNNAELRHEAEMLSAKNEMMTIAIIAGFIILAILIVIFNVLAHRRRLIKQKQLLEQEVNRKTAELKDINEEIITQNEMLEEKNIEISRANRETNDSINYAQRIQNAILPDLDQFKDKGIRDSFSLFRPYKTIGGDFYWARQLGDRIIFACADCTGHGVPGALMTMIGSTALNEICATNAQLSAGDILTLLDQQVKETLGQSNDKTVQDGMDIAIAIYSPATHKLEFSLARRPLYVAQDGHVTEYKGVKRSIGDCDERSCQNAFETQVIDLFPTDTFYMCSDGIADQFGGQDQYGHEGKRLRNAGLQRMLTSIAHLDMKEQKTALTKLLEDWQGTCAQVDDISMVAIRV